MQKTLTNCCQRWIGRMYALLNGSVSEARIARSGSENRKTMFPLQVRTICAGTTTNGKTKRKIMKNTIDFDLFVLRLPEAIGMCRKAYLNVAKRLALTAFLAGDGHGETAVQFEQIGEYLCKSDLCGQFISRVAAAINVLPVKHASLIKSVYVRRTSPSAIAEKYGVSTSTVYRKLRVARKNFVNALTANGVTKQWLVDNFGEIPLVTKVKEVNGVKTVTFLPDLSLLGLKSALKK